MLLSLCWCAGNKTNHHAFNFVNRSGSMSYPHSQAWRRGKRKSAWYTLFAHARNFVTTMFICVRTYTGGVINSPHYCASWCSFWVSFISRCSMPSGSWVPQDKAQERTGCFQWVYLPRKHTFMQLSTNLGKSISTTAYLFLYPIV